MPPKRHGSKTFNNPLGFEPGFWQRKSDLNVAVPKRSVFERLSSVRKAHWVLLSAAKRLSAVVECHNRDTSCILYSRVKDSRLQSNLKVKN
jgi:hypothetical protein